MNWGKGITIALVLFIGFIVTLGVILMRQDVDLVAVGVPWTSEERSVNSGKMGNHVMWLLIPAEVYCDYRMFKHYNTVGNTWSLPFVKKFKPPLDKAFDAWYLFTRKSFGTKLIDSFF